MLDEKDEHVVDPAQKESVCAKDEIDHAQPEGDLVGVKCEARHENVIQHFIPDVGVWNDEGRKDEC